MEASGWFATTSLAGASAPVLATVQELMTMLDEQESDVVLAHRDGQAPDLTLAVGRDGAVVSQLGTHEHVRRTMRPATGCSAPRARSTDQLRSIVADDRALSRASAPSTATSCTARGASAPAARRPRPATCGGARP